MSDTEHLLKGIEGGIRQRASYSNFASRFVDKSTAMTTGLDGLRATLTALKDGSLKNTINTLTNELKTARESLLAHAEEGANGFVRKSNADASKFAEALTAYNKVENKFHDFLSGKINIGEGDGAKVSGAVKEAFNKAVLATGDVKSVMNGWFGKFQVDGWVETLKHNLKFWDKTVTQGRVPEVCFRAGGVAVGTVMTADAIFRSKSDDEPRSILTRVLEGLTGIGIAAGSAVLGAAR